MSTTSSGRRSRSAAHARVSAGQDRARELDVEEVVDGLEEIGDVVGARRTASMSPS